MADNLLLFVVGDRYEFCQEIKAGLMADFCSLSGDNNPMHLDDGFASAHGFLGRIVYGNLLGAMLSKLVGVELPTKGVIILKQSLEFRHPVYVGDEVRLIAEVVSIYESVRSVQLKLQFLSMQQKDPVCTGQCLIKCL